jgi:hypothetical protein
MKKAIIINIIIAAALSACANHSQPVAKPANAKAYPLTTCLVTDNRLGSMGTPVTLYHGTQEIKLCCKPCVRKFESQPEKYLGKLP